MMGKLAMIIWVVVLLYGCQPSVSYFRNEGLVYGTTYNVTYEFSTDLGPEILAGMKSIEMSMSTFNKESVISRINRNDSTVIPDSLFLAMYRKAMEVSEKTYGAFDITVAPLVNAWGFGFSEKSALTQEKVDSILEFVGFHKIELVQGRLKKKDPRILLDASAIAKGQGVDVVAGVFEKKGIVNYLVEIGGEVRVKGINPQGKPWAIGIDKPVDDPELKHRELQDVLYLTDCALATSGNYRNFYMENGVKYAHTIHPHTGFPAQSDLLSVSVVAPDCMTADAYATAFMVLGLEKSLEILKNDPTLEAYFIFNNAVGGMQVRFTDGFNRFLKGNDVVP